MAAASSVQNTARSTCSCCSRRSCSCVRSCRIATRPNSRPSDCSTRPVADRVFPDRRSSHVIGVLSTSSLALSTCARRLPRRITPCPTTSEAGMASISSAAPLNHRTTPPASAATMPTGIECNTVSANVFCMATSSCNIALSSNSAT